MAQERPRHRWLFAALAASALLALGWWLGRSEPSAEPADGGAGAVEVPENAGKPDASKEVAQGETRLNLLVLDEGGYPTGDVSLRVLDASSGALLAEGVSNNDGWVRVTVPRGASVEIIGAEGWFVEAPRGELEVRGAEQEQQLTVLWPCRTEFEVLDLNGDPFVGARVALVEDRGGYRRFNPFATLDAEGKAKRGLQRCAEVTLLVRSPPGAKPRETWSVPVELIDGGSLLIDLAEVPQPPPKPEVPRRELALSLDCTDCPSWLSCRAPPGVPGLAYYNERYCEGGPHQWTCDCPTAPLSIWGTWLDPLTENGPGEPLGVVPAEVTQASLSVSEDFASFEAQWVGPKPCSWRLTLEGQWVTYGDCEEDGWVGHEGLRPAPYVLHINWETRDGVASWALDLAPGQDLDLGELRP